MRTLAWIGTGSVQDLGLLSNWVNSNGNLDNLGAATSLPAIGDRAYGITSIGISGGTVVGTCVADAGAGSIIYGGTFTGTITGSIAGGVFNGEINGDFGGVISGGVFNGNGTTICTVQGGTFNGSVIFATLKTATINHRMSVNNGDTWLYSPNSPAVAPASKVLAGTSNLGVAGTLPLSQVLSPNGTALKLERNRPQR